MDMWEDLLRNPAFVNHIAAAFGWSYAQVSLAMSLRGMETGALYVFRKGG